MRESLEDFRFRKTTQCAGLLCLCFLAILCWDQSCVWLNAEDYRFGFLVPAFVLYVLYERWPRIKNAFAQETKKDNSLSIIVFLIFCIGLLLFTIGILLRILLGPSRPATQGITCGTIIICFSMGFLHGEGPSKKRFESLLCFIFPLFIWVLSVPMLSLFENRVQLLLLDRITSITYGIFDLFDFYLEKEGNIFIMPDGSRVGIADACSGIRSFIACLFVGSFLSAVFLDRFWKKVLLVSLAVFLAFLTNLMRSLFLTSWAYAHGAQAIEGIVHDIAGYAVLALTTVALIAGIPVLKGGFRGKNQVEGDFNATL